MAEDGIWRRFVVLGVFLLSSSFALKVIASQTLIPPTSAQSITSPVQEKKKQGVIKVQKAPPKTSSNSSGETPIKATGSNNVDRSNAQVSSPKPTLKVRKQTVGADSDKITRQPKIKSDFPRWAVALLSAVVGLLGGAGLEEWRRHRRLNYYRQAIYEEVRDVHSAIKTRIAAMEEILKAYLAKQQITSIPSTINYPIFQKWYAETVLKFSEDERLALTHIYGRLEGVVWKFGVIRDNWDINSGDGDADQENLRRIIQTTEGAYGDARELDVMIELLLRDKQKYKIRAPETDERLDKIRKQINEDLLQWKLDSKA